MSNQVWLDGNTLVGTVSADARQGAYHTFLTEERNVDARISIWTTSRTVEVTKFDHVRLAPSEFQSFLARRHVPDSATQKQLADRDALRFEWRIFKVDLATYEAIFDLDEFEPI